MRATVRNLGVIKEEATIDLKPLTIFIGPNNAGKTWLAYALAGILSSYGSEKYAQAYIEKQVPSIYESLDKAIEQILTEGNATIDLQRFANDCGEKYFNDVAQFARKWMGEFLGTQLAHFEDMDISLSLAEMKEQFLDQISQYSQYSGISVGPKGSLLTIRKRPNEEKLYAYTSTELQDANGQEEQIGVKIPPEEVRGRLVNFVFTALRRSLYPGIRIFPTERTTLIATDPRLPSRIRPLRSFLNMLSSMFESGSVERAEREKAAKRDQRIRKYIKLAEVLEKQILEGDVDFSTPEPDPRREILFRTTTGAFLDLPVVSSMIKELSPLVLYLRYLAEAGELLVIDEPEMNLHPEAQAKMIEFLAMLVNAGLRVLITTHSPYIVDHLTNLMQAAEYEGDDQALLMGKFFLKNKDAFISQEHVSVYLINPGETKNILSEHGKINWGTFGDVTDQIATIHYEL